MVTGVCEMENVELHSSGRKINIYEPAWLSAVTNQNMCHFYGGGLLRNENDASAIILIKCLKSSSLLHFYYINYYQK